MAEQGLIVTTSGKMYLGKFEDPLYKTVGKFVGGWIEIVHPTGLKHPYCMVVDEEGLLKTRPINAFGSYLYGTAKHGYPIVGDIVILKDGYRNGEPDIVGLDDVDLAKVAKKALKFGITWDEIVTE